MLKQIQFHIKRKKTDADVLSFYFLISIPQNADEGVILFQRTGRHGFQSNFNNFLQKSFRCKFPHLTLYINDLMLEEVVRRTIFSGSIKELKCVKYQTPIDIVDGLDTGHNEVSGNIEFIVKAKEIPFRNRINEFFNKNKSVNINNLVEIRDFDFSYDTVKVDVEINGSMYHYDLGNIGKMRHSLDITKDIALDPDGRPVFDSIHTRAVKYLNEINSSLYK